MPLASSQGKDFTFASRMGNEGKMANQQGAEEQDNQIFHDILDRLAAAILTPAPPPHPRPGPLFRSVGTGFIVPADFLDSPQGREHYFAGLCQVGHYFKSQFPRGIPEAAEVCGWTENWHDGQRVVRFYVTTRLNE